MSTMKINNINIEKLSVGAVVVGVGALVDGMDDKGVVVTHRFHVELPDFVARDVQEVLTKHFGNVNSFLKLKPNVSLGTQSKSVSHKELEGLKDPD